MGPPLPLTTAGTAGVATPIAPATRLGRAIDAVIAARHFSDP
jgi:hypothetical protein